MIQITRSLARQTRAVIRKASPAGLLRSWKPWVTLQAGTDGLRLRTQHADVALELHVAGESSDESLSIPLEAMEDFEGRHDDPVQLSQFGDDKVQARWTDGGVPQLRSYTTPSTAPDLPFPALPRKLVVMGAGFRKALSDAVHTAAKQSPRLGLTRIQLRGRAGEIVSTDGGHLLVQRGFSLPWKDDVLLPALGVFGCRELPEDEQVELGRTDTHVCVRIGRWHVFLTIDKEARYPAVDKVLTQVSEPGTTLRLSADDAAFLTQSLPRLPGRDDPFAPVTLDLNGQVLLRAQAEGDERITELLLNNSKATGNPIRLVSKRHELATAMQLGFTEFQVTRPNVPVVARDQQRIFLWMPLEKTTGIPPSDNAIRIASTTNADAAEPAAPERKFKIMPPPPNGHPTNGTPERNQGQAEARDGIGDLMADAEQARTHLLEASACLGRLMTGLKQHRRQSRAVSAAMQSLRRLNLEG